MTAILLALLAQSPAHLEPGADGCLRVLDAGSGWKTAGGFANGTKVLVLSDRDSFDLSYLKPRWGTVELELAVPGDTRAVRVHFLQRLDGMRVEVRGSDVRGRSVPLLPERRVSGSTLNLEWTATGVRYVTIFLRHHVRTAPVVAAWQAGSLWAVSESEPLLTFLLPGDPSVELCRAENQDLQPTGVTR